MKPSALVVHCSDSPGGTIEIIDGWHKARGFRRKVALGRRDLRHVGYQYVIGNGRKTPGGRGRMHFEDDGRVYPGRKETEIGAHAWGMNGRAIGICLIGKGPHFTLQQVRALTALCLHLMAKWRIEPTDVIGHRETKREQSKKPGKRKECPRLDMVAHRTRLWRLSREFEVIV